MIKKYIIAGITACLGFIGFSSASRFGHGVVGNYSNNTNNSDYDVMIARYREFNTDFLGTTKRIFTLNNGNDSFFRGTNGRLKMTDEARPLVADVKYFYVCDYINGDFSSFSNCTKYKYSDNETILNNMMNKIVVGDRFFYGTETVMGVANVHFQAVNITDLNKCLVFYFGNCRANSYSSCAFNWNLGNYNLGIYYDTNDITTDNNGLKRIGLENLDSTIGYNFGTIPNNIIGVSPVFETPEEETPNNGGNPSNNYFCPTIGQLMKNMGANYNTGLCYNNTMYFDGTTMQTIEKKSIFENFTDYEEYTNRISIYFNNCTAPATTTACQNAFSGEYGKYSIIANAINNNVDEKKLWNYCNMGINYDPNATTCVSSGYITEKPTMEEITNEIINSDSTTILTPGTGTIFDNMNTGEGTGTTYEDVATRDVFGNITQIYDKITRIFEGRSGVNGILPDYILWLIFVILFFTVLMKK